MRIFFGVQATGNGHITRARALAPKLKQAGIKVDYLFTGRPWEQLFEMDVFGDFQWRQGLTFATKFGHVKYFKTALTCHPVSFFRDVKDLDLKLYDVVISDFEPVTAWAARMQGIKTVGIGHQYAFGYDIPKANVDLMGTQLLKYFAPVATHLGVHWHHFHNPILPPIIEVDYPQVPVIGNKIVVYLPFENLNQVVRLLRRFDQYEFYVYSPDMPDKAEAAVDHVHIRQLSRVGFQEDFANAAGVISNAGFELASESLQMGKKILVKPLHGQMEQGSNALALELLRFGQVMQNLDSATIETWLEKSQAVRVVYPCVAQAVTDWLLKGDLRVEQSWINRIWEETIHIPG